MTHRTARSAAVAVLGILAAAGRAHAQPQAQPASSTSEIERTQMVARHYITTADLSNPNGVVFSAPAVPSGSPTGYNDPALGFNNARYWAKDPKYSGVTQLIMTYRTRNLSTGAIGSASFICSGALINGGYSVLTAAHCLNNSVSGGVEQTLQNVQVRLGQHFGGNTTHEPGAGAPSTNQAFNYVRTVGAANTVIHPGYSGSVIDQRDIAVVNLGTPAPDIYQSYDLYTPSAMGLTYNIAGWGGRGNGEFGRFASGAAGARIRQGMNAYDLSYADPNWSAAFMTFLFGARGPQDVYLADFDNGVAANDALCRLAMGTLGGAPIWTGGNVCDLGDGIDEVSTAGGDSGGPSFVNGKIAAVTSFGQTWGTGFFGDVRSGLNSSFGELNGLTRVDINATWVQASVTTPEPATILLVAGGLLGLGAIARRRRAA